MKIKFRNKAKRRRATNVIQNKLNKKNTNISPQHTGTGLHQSK